MNIEIDHEIADRIVVASLKETLECFQKDYDSPDAVGVFSWDYEEDKKQIKKRIKAIKKTLYLYTGEEL